MLAHLVHRGAAPRHLEDGAARLGRGVEEKEVEEVEGLEEVNEEEVNEEVDKEVLPG